MSGDPWLDGPAFAAVDWARTPLGPVEGWSPALRRAADLVVHTRYAATLFWGPELVLVYNDAYVELIGDKHPSALGRPAREVFPEAWHLIGPLMESVLAGEGASYVKDQLVPLYRHGFLEDCYFTYSYSPVHGPDGRVEGVIDIAAETTVEVVALRRLAVLSQLRARLAEVEAVDDLAGVVLDVVGQARDDIVEVEYRKSSRRPLGSTLPPAAPRSLRGTDLMLQDTEAGRVAWLPIRSSGTDPADPPVLVVKLNDRLLADDDYVSFLKLASTAVVQTRNRLEAREVERRIAMGERRLSEALQHSLLTPPRQPAGLHVAVRYRASAAQAEVGGDWYDSFVDARGRLTLTVGDVSGHDRTAAAGMAQARNMLRALAYSLDQSLPDVLARLDKAMDGLELGVLATAVLVRVEPAEPRDGRARWTVRWSNAGGPPPVVLRASGAAEVLDGGDLMLGVDDEAARTERSVVVEEGCALVLYTDGLVERRGTSFTHGQVQLARVVERCAGRDAEATADRILTALGDGAEDDVALLVVRFGAG